MGCIMEQMYVIKVCGKYLIGKGDVNMLFGVIEGGRQVRTTYLFSEDYLLALKTNKPEKYIEELKKDKIINAEVIPVFGE